MEDNGYTINENGVPCCPHDPSLPMKREGSKSHLKSKIPTMKFVCPKMKWEYNKTDKTKRRILDENGWIGKAIQQKVNVIREIPKLYGDKILPPSCRYYLRSFNSCEEKAKFVERVKYDKGNCFR